MSDPVAKSDASPGMAQLRKRVGQVCNLLGEYAGLAGFVGTQDPAVAAALNALRIACAVNSFEKSPEQQSDWGPGGGDSGSW